MTDGRSSNDALQNIVTLKNGDTMPLVMVTVVATSLKYLLESYPIVFYELVMSCRNREHQLFGRTGEKLIELALVDWIDADGRATVQDITRSIVLSAVEGDELEMHLVNPLAS